MLVEAVDTIEAVGAEEVALCLDQVRRAASTTVAVEIAERRGERGNGEPVQRRHRDDAAERAVRFLQHRREGRRDHKVVGIRHGAESGGDVV